MTWGRGGGGLGTSGSVVTHAVERDPGLTILSGSKVLHGWNTISHLDWHSSQLSWGAAVAGGNNTGANYRVHWVTTVADPTGFTWANMGTSTTPGSYSVWNKGSWGNGTGLNSFYQTVGAGAFSWWGINIDDGGRGEPGVGYAELEYNFP